jgi:isopentenyl phosphate kinase
VILLKIGGSVLTDKGRESTLQEDNLRMVARQVAEARTSRLVLVHGAGSFGHPQVVRYLSGGLSASGIWKTHFAVRSLNTALIEELQSQGAPSLPIHPLNSVTLDTGKIAHFDTSALKLMLRSNIIPVLHGDVVMDRSQGFNILSGDQIVAFLAQKMRPKKIGVGSDVDGIIYRNRKLNRIDPNQFEKYRDGILGSRSTDVTGGMLHKVVELLEIAKSGIQSEIFNATLDGNITKFLTSHQDVGTIISTEKE